jgi:hypothetical protein
MVAVAGCGKEEKEAHNEEHNPLLGFWSIETVCYGDSDTLISPYPFYYSTLRFYGDSVSAYTYDIDFFTEGITVNKNYTIKGDNITVRNNYNTRIDTAYFEVNGDILYLRNVSGENGLSFLAPSVLTIKESCYKKDGK